MFRGRARQGESEREDSPPDGRVVESKSLNESTRAFVPRARKVLSRAQKSGALLDDGLIELKRVASGSAFGVAGARERDSQLKRLLDG